MIHPHSFIPSQFMLSFFPSSHGQFRKVYVREVNGCTVVWLSADTVTTSLFPYDSARMTKWCEFFSVKMVIQTIHQAASVPHSPKSAGRKPDLEIILRLELMGFKIGTFGFRLGYMGIHVKGSGPLFSLVAFGTPASGFACVRQGTYQQPDKSATTQRTARIRSFFL